MRMLGINCAERPQSAFFVFREDDKLLSSVPPMP
jgi:hypothetical protein